MTFFLYQIVARIVALVLFVICCRELRTALIERKIKYESPDFLDWWEDTWSAQRDTAPVQYWFIVGVQAMSAAACLVVVIFGWWHPAD